MSKAVIYIDTEDDITSVLDKVKAAKDDIVALVPPKRSGVLQSVVNLKLLQRGSSDAGKRVVLITNDSALMSLAGGVKIPTAKNLQTKPEVAAAAPAVDEGSDVIKGEDISVGEMDDAYSKEEASSDSAEPGNDISDEDAKAAATAAAGATLAKPSGKSSLKVPDFMKFRKRLLIGAALAVLLLILILWALLVAPKLSVAINAKTEPVEVAQNLTLDPNAQASDAKSNVLNPITQQIKKTNSTEFSATGEKTVGEKASGTTVIYNCESRDSINVPAGTALNANGLNFITASAVEVPGGESSSPFGGCDQPGTASVKINAQEIGDEYNQPGGTQYDVAGYDGDVYGETQNGTSGGSKKEVTVVSQADVNNAKNKLAEADNDDVKQELIDKFEEGDYVIEKSFQVVDGATSVSPGVGKEAQNANLSIETTYTIKAVKKEALKQAITQAVRGEISADDQKKVYDHGLEELAVREYSGGENGQDTMRIQTTAFVGAKIDKNKLKKQMVDKRLGEIQELTNGLPNVEEVNIDFSPFWVSSVSETDDIELTFEIRKNGEE